MKLKSGSQAKSEWAPSRRALRLDWKEDEGFVVAVNPGANAPAALSRKQWVPVRSDSGRCERPNITK